MKALPVNILSYEVPFPFLVNFSTFDIFYRKGRDMKDPRCHPSAIIIIYSIYSFFGLSVSLYITVLKRKTERNIIVGLTNVVKRAIAIEFFYF